MFTRLGWIKKEYKEEVDESEENCMIRWKKKENVEGSEEESRGSER